MNVFTIKSKCFKNIIAFLIALIFILPNLVASTNNSPVAFAGSNDSTCGLDYQFSASSPLPGTGLWTCISGHTVIFSDSSSPTAATTLSAYDTNGNMQLNTEVAFQWTVSDSTGTSSDTVFITFMVEPIALAGLDNWTCSNVFTLNANEPNIAGAQGIWQSDFQTATFDDPTDPDATATVPNTGSFPWQPLPVGTFGDTSYASISFNWTVSNGTCVDADTVNITFYQSPDAFAGTDTSVCGTTYQMHGEFSIGNSNGLWSLISGPGIPTFSNSQDPQSMVTVTANGQYSFRWKEDNANNLLCSEEDIVHIHFIDIPQPYAGPDTVVCGDTINLDAINSYGNGQWLPTIGGVIFDISDPNSLAYHPGTGTNDYVWFVWQEYTSHGSTQCLSTDSVLVVFVVQPEADVFFDPGVSLDHICGNVETDVEDIFVAMLPGITGPAVQSYWTGSSDVNYFPTASAVNPDSVVAGNYGVHWFSWVIENHVGNSVCMDASDTFLVNFIEPPIANAGPLYDTACIYPEFADMHQLQGAWSATTGDSVSGMWMMTSPYYEFWQVTATDTVMSGFFPNDFVRPNYIDINNPETASFIWMEQNWGAPINGNGPDYCSDWDTTHITFVLGLFPIAGNDTITENSTFTLNGSFASPYLSSMWEVVTTPWGAIVQIENPDSLTTEVQVSEHGVYRFSLTGTNENCELGDEVEITYVDSLISIDEISTNSNYQLFQNIPNPYKQNTQFKFYVPKTTKVEMAVYNLLGERIAIITNKEYPEGRHIVNFNSMGLAPGTYLYSLETSEVKMVRKMVIVR